MPLIPPHKQKKKHVVRMYYRHQTRNFLIAVLLLLFCLLIGVAGYHYTDGIPWIDSLHNASMILSGMGPVVEIRSTAGKLFSSVYALFSGVMFITNIGIILTPIVRHLLLRLHVDEDEA